MLDAGKPDTGAPEHDRAFGLGQCRRQVGQDLLDRIAADIGLVGHQNLTDDLGLLYVHGNVDDDRPHAAAGGDRVGLGQFLPKLFGARHLDRIFGDRPHHVDDPGFLKAGLADVGAVIGVALALVHLAGDVQAGDRIEIGAGNPGDEVGGAGAGGRHRHADGPVHAPDGVGGHRGRLLVLEADIGQRGVARDGIDHDGAGAAGQQEDARAADPGEEFGNVFRAGHAPSIPR